ncbi:S-adenosyl-L-methionine-dependent methyltransferase [Podospora appendiculata]|uniref:S-adenosyl-L-methionine-dependent methyltransferase n=1 Tax=Podospora appendiculata TaxID=314037 RepID=A0AAE0X7H2_9PEZI|nr:S-adenosyl-L-methionine-dependent methyltransferase [Podospora appendiculata]
MSVAKAAEGLHKLFATSIGDPMKAMLLDNARRVCAPLASRMLTQIGLDSESATPFKLFDNACGPGVVAAELQRLVRPEVLQQSSILCGDFSDQLVGLVKERIVGEGWVNTEANQIDAQNTGLPSGEFTHVTANIGFHVIPDSESALDESIRILQPGGILGFTTWHRPAGWAPDVQMAFESFPFEAPFAANLVQTTPWGDWADVNWVRKTLESKGLEDIKVDVFAFLSRVDGAEHFMASTGMMIDWVMQANWSDELRKEHGKEEVHGLVREFVEKKYHGRGWDQTGIAVIASGRVPRL